MTQLLQSTDSSSATESSSGALIVQATGLGKTVQMAALAARWPVGRVMMISHRFELNAQAVKTFENFGSMDVDWEQADLHADQRHHLAHCVVASVQTLVSRPKGRYRYEKFRPREFGLIMIDEAHRSVAASYRQVIQYFREGNPNIKILGVTATPDRLDKVGLRNNFDTTVCNRQISWGIDHGYLVPIVPKFVEVTSLDLSSVKIGNTQFGKDFSQAQLATIVEQARNLHSMSQVIAEHLSSDEQGIVYTTSVRQAHEMVCMVRDYRDRLGMPQLSIEAVDQKTPKPKRRALIEAFRGGECHCLINVGVLTEGFDAWRAKQIFMCSPTASRAKFTQCLGRGTRPQEGTVEGLDSAEARRAAIALSEKPCCKLIDFVGNANSHSPVVNVADVLAGREIGEGEARDEFMGAFRGVLSNGDFSRDATEAMIAAREEIRAARERARLKVTAESEYVMHDIKLGSMSSYVPPRIRVPPWLASKPPTDKQISMLKRLGFTMETIETLNPKTASIAIDEGIRTSDSPFAVWLRKQPPRPSKYKKGTEWNPK